jgi:starch synthase (maltosyl-transferring)
LQESGFDFLYNSSKWWDFQEDWCLEQYEEFRRIAPSISFPETHDTPRLIVEAQGSLPRVRQRYLFAAFFSTGLLMPMGFEYGLKKKLHVVNSRPQDWQDRTYDLTDFITRVNQLKRNCPILQEEGPLERLTPPGQPVVILRKSSEVHPGVVLAVINATSKPQPQVMLNCPQLMGFGTSALEELVPEAPTPPLGAEVTIDLKPWDLRLFYARP